MNQTANQKEAPKISEGSRPDTLLIMFGIIFPILAFALDLVLFNGGVTKGWPIFLPCLAAIGIAAAGLSLYVRSHLILCSILVGTLAVAGILAAYVGFLLLPNSILGILFFGLGLLGFIPFGTAYALIGKAWHIYRSTVSKKVSWMLFGAAIGCLPLLLDYVEETWIQKRRWALYDNGPVAVQALYDLARYPLLFGRAHYAVCENIDKLWKQGEAVQRDLALLLGEAPRRTCRRHD
jgi:hypothetical protein